MYKLIAKVQRIKANKKAPELPKTTKSKNIFKTFSKKQGHGSLPGHLDITMSSLGVKEPQCEQNKNLKTQNTIKYTKTVLKTQI